MTRPLETATAAAFDGAILPLAVIMRLDILDDPLLAWNGIGDLTFGASETGDTALDGQTFHGLSNIAEIKTISEGVGGSDKMEISIPGVDITDVALRQVVYNRNRWQFRRAWLWMMVLHPDTGAIQGKPFRIKTGRIDGMPYSENNGKGVITCRIEGQQSYGDEPLDSRYTEQVFINANDNSQNWVHSLANMTANMGTPSAAPVSSGLQTFAFRGREVMVPTLGRDWR